nr:MAG TPA_asm: hypothetical protein [Caudoviricetes sp.]DAP81924.1 MAG TPA: hypothetical protein [Caudoviricetes sp.]
MNYPCCSPEYLLHLQSFSESVPSREMRKRTHRKMQNREQQPTQW